MKRTLLEIDEELLGQAQATLGTKTMKATVDQALREVIAAAARRRQLGFLGDPQRSDLADDAVMHSAWR